MRSVRRAARARDLLPFAKSAACANSPALQRARGFFHGLLVSYSTLAGNNLDHVDPHAYGLDALRRQGREGVRLEAARARRHGGGRDRVRGARRRAGRRTRLPLGTVITSSAPSRGPGSTAACARAGRPGPGLAAATATPAARRARARAASPAASARATPFVLLP